MDMAGYLFVHFTGEDKDGEQIYFSLSRDGLHWEDLYCRPPGFTVMPPGKYLAGGLQSGCTANLTGAQYKKQTAGTGRGPTEENLWIRKDGETK